MLSTSWANTPDIYISPSPVKLQNTVAGAGDGDRTHVTSLEGWGSTIELHPPKAQKLEAYYLKQVAFNQPYITKNGGGGWIRTNVGVRQRVYSPSPLATRASLLAPINTALFGAWKFRKYEDLQPVVNFKTK